MRCALKVLFIYFLGVCRVGGCLVLCCVFVSWLGAVWVLWCVQTGRDAARAGGGRRGGARGGAGGGGGSAGGRRAGGGGEKWGKNGSGRGWARGGMLFSVLERFFLSWLYIFCC